MKDDWPIIDPDDASPGAVLVANRQWSLAVLLAQQTGNMAPLIALLRQANFEMLMGERRLLARLLEHGKKFKVDGRRNQIGRLSSEWKLHRAAEMVYRLHRQEHMLPETAFARAAKFHGVKLNALKNFDAGRGRLANRRRRRR